MSTQPTWTWGEDGGEVGHFGDGLAFKSSDATKNHEAISGQVEASVGRMRLAPHLPAA